MRIQAKGKHGGYAVSSIAFLWRVTNPQAADHFKKGIGELELGQARQGCIDLALAIRSAIVLGDDEDLVES